MEQSFFQKVYGIIIEHYDWFLKGARDTLIIAITATFLGFLIGLVIGTIKTIPHDRYKKGRNIFLKIVNIFINIYIEVFRGTPMMVQAMVIYYGLHPFLSTTFGLDLQALPAGIFIVSINTGAYLSEVVRGGIESVDRGQTEAAHAIGMNHAKTMLYVILPQAIRNIMPALGNEFIINIKDTSVLNVITVTELFFMTKSIAGSTYLTFETYIVTAAIYLFLTISLSAFLRFIEKKMDGEKTYTMASSTMPHHIKAHRKDGAVK